MEGKGTGKRQVVRRSASFVPVEMLSQCLQLRTSLLCRYTLFLPSLPPSLPPSPLPVYLGIKAEFCDFGAHIA
jgi:hypothetical protein